VPLVITKTITNGNVVVDADSISFDPSTGVDNTIADFRPDVPTFENAIPESARSSSTVITNKKTNKIYKSKEEDKSL